MGCKIMVTQQILNIHNSHDIISTRMQVREAARHVGLVPGDQARISLATSSLIEGLGLGFDAGTTSVGIEELNDGKKIGLSVIFTFEDPRERQPIQAAATNIGWMVDNLDISFPEHNKMVIILTKWAIKRQS